VPPSSESIPFCFPASTAGPSGVGAAFRSRHQSVVFNSNEMAWTYGLAVTPKPGESRKRKGYLWHTVRGVPRRRPYRRPAGDSLARGISTKRFGAPPSCDPSFSTVWAACLGSPRCRQSDRGDHFVRHGWSVESTVPVPADAKPVPWDSQYRFTGFQ